MNHEAAKNAVKEFLGPASAPDYLDKYASLMHYLGQREALIALDDQEFNSWHAAQYVAALQYLTPAPRTKARAQQILCRYWAKNMLSGYIQPFTSDQQPYVLSYAAGLIEWALFSVPRVPKEGLEKALSHSAMPPDLRWRLLMQLVARDLWPLKELLPALYLEPEFAQARNSIWSSSYTLYRNFSDYHASLRTLEKPISSCDAGQIATSGRPETLKVGIWSKKLGTYNSSMTTVHPWLKHLQANDLEVFLISDKTMEGDPLQNEYRRTYGANFIDSANLSDDKFIARVRELDLDVIIPVNSDRPQLQKTRLARVHLDVLAQFEIEGFADQTLISRSMIDKAFLDETARHFISIPDPMLVFSPLPPAEIAGRTSIDRFCFGIFSRFAKVDSETFDIWAQILKECPLSDILISTFTSGQLTYYIAKTEFAARGIDPDRIRVNQSTPDHAAHLQRYNHVDLMIDTFPMGGAVSAVDSFYMGVPVISLNKDSRPVTKVLKSIFAVLDNESGAVVGSEKEYVDFAKAAYAKGPRSKMERESLRNITMRSCLFDSARYADIIKRAIREAATSPSTRLTVIEG